MATIDLTKYGITGATEIVHNPSYELLLKKRLRQALKVTIRDRLVNLAL